MKGLRTGTLWRYTAREVRRRPGRTLLTLLGIAIGVAAVVAVNLTADTTTHAYRNMFAQVSDRAALEIVAEGLGAFDPASVADVAAVPGVGAVVPVLQEPGALVGAGGPQPVLILGIDPNGDRAARDYVLREGQMLGDGDGLLLEAGFASGQKLQVGQTAKLLTPAGIFRLPVVGLLEPRGAAAFNGGSIVFLPLKKAQSMFALGDRVNSLQLVLDRGADPRRVEEQLTGRLPAGFTAQEPIARSEHALGAVASTEGAMALLSAVSLVAGGFVILNSFLMNLGERRRQLAILRALGTTRAQVTRLLLREALVLGAIGTVAGMAAGLALAVLFTGAMEGMLNVVLLPLHLSAKPFLIAGVLGPGMSLAATYLPARRAGRRAPLEELFPRRTAVDERARRWPCALGVALLLGAALVETGLVHGWFPRARIKALIASDMAMMLAGCVLVVPLFQPALARLASVLLRPVLGPEGRLAFRHLDRHRARTGLTVGVLFIAVVTVIGTGHLLLDNIGAVQTEFRGWTAGDYLVRPIALDASPLFATAPLPEALADQIAHIDGVGRVDRLSLVAARVDGRRVLVMARSFAADRPLPLVLNGGRPEDVVRGLLRGEVVLATALAKRLGVGVGDEVTLESRRGPVKMRVAGTATEYAVGGMALHMDVSAARDLLGLEGAQILIVSARKDAGNPAPALASFCDEHGLLLQSNADFRRMVDHMVGGVVGLLWVLMALMFVVASLGVVNTLTMSVLEQTRELGVLRALGMRRAQVAKMIVSQALALGVIGLIPGAVAGLVLAYLMNLATYPLTGNAVPFRLHPSLILGAMTVAPAVAVLVAVVPARRAARLRVIEALQYE
jgi:putative ABC transport system permease protein